MGLGIRAHMQGGWIFGNASLSNLATGDVERQNSKIVRGAFKGWEVSNDSPFSLDGCKRVGLLQGWGGPRAAGWGLEKGAKPAGPQSLRTYGQQGGPTNSRSWILISSGRARSLRRAKQDA